MADDDYLLDNRVIEASGRFDALSQVFDAVTFRHIDALGQTAGWRCWEVGAGGPSVPNGLAERVGPTGSVVATDLDITWLAERVGSGIEVVQHDVANDVPPAGGGFDLIHARLVLLHIPARDKALRRMVSALRPGGVLLIEDFDIDLQTMLCPDAYGPDQLLANRIKDAFRALLFSRGVDPTFGRRLPRILREHGLLDVIADAYFPLALPAVSALERANTAQVRGGLVAGGITDTEIDRFLTLLDAGTLDLATAPLISASGRRP
jgi:SAM-dependent methyltransferase